MVNNEVYFLHLTTIDLTKKSQSTQKEKYASKIQLSIMIITRWK